MTESNEKLKREYFEIFEIKNDTLLTIRNN